MKPKIICHMISSVDGRLLVDRYTGLSKEAPENYSLNLYSEVMEKMRPDGTIFGKTTIQEMAFPETSKFLDEAPTKDKNIYIAERKYGTASIIFDANGSIAYNAEAGMGSDLIVVLGEGVSDNYLAHLKEHHISYFFAGADGKDLNLAIEILHEKFGLKTIALVGGATINGAFLKAGLIDELVLQLYPGIDGLSGIPSIFEYKGSDNELPAEGQRMELIDIEKKEHGIVYLRYRFHKV